MNDSFSHVGDMRLAVSQLKWPSEKETLANLSSRTLRSCSGDHEAACCGPLAVTYQSVSLVWSGGKITWNSTTMELEENQTVVPYQVEDVDQVTISHSQVTVDMNSQEEHKAAITVTVEDKLIFSLRLTGEEFSLWNKTEGEGEVRPWLDLKEFPLTNSSGGDVLHSSGLLTGLSHMFPSCRSLSCVLLQCPRQAKTEHCCDWVLGRSLLSRPNYPQEITSNYISFSRLSPCHPAQDFSLPDCPQGWTRDLYQCLRVINRKEGRPYHRTGQADNVRLYLIAWFSVRLSASGGGNYYAWCSHSTAGDSSWWE